MLILQVSRRVQSSIGQVVKLINHIEKSLYINLLWKTKKNKNREVFMAKKQKSALQQHKTSDKIKWIIVFTSIVLIVASMAAMMVQFIPMEESGGSSSIDNNSNSSNFDVVNLDLSNFAFCLSESGDETVSIEQNGVLNTPDVNINLNSLNSIFGQEIFNNDYVYGNILSSNDNFRFLFEKDGVYHSHEVCVDSIIYELNERSYTGDNGEVYVATFGNFKINYFFDESADGNGDVRYDTVSLTWLIDSNVPDSQEYIGFFDWNIYSELSKYHNNGYEFVGMYFIPDEFPTANCLIYNSANK